MPHVPNVPSTDKELTVWEECCKRGRELTKVGISIVSVFGILFLGHLGESTVVWAVTVDFPWEHRAPAEPLTTVPTEHP